MQGRVGGCHNGDCGCITPGTRSGRLSALEEYACLTPGAGYMETGHLGDC